MRIFAATLCTAAAVLALGASTPWWRQMPAVVPYAVACGAFAAALAVALRPWSQGWRGAVLWLLVPLVATVFVYDDTRDGVFLPLLGLGLMLVLGAGLRGVARLRPERLAEALRSRDAEIRRGAVLDLGVLLHVEYEPGAEQCRALLAQATHDRDADVAREARAQLEPEGTAAPLPLEPVPAAAAPTGLPGPRVATRVPGDAEIAAGVQPPPTPEAWVAVLRAGEPAACRRAVEALVALGAAAVPALEAALAEDDPDVRVDARTALARIRDGAEPSV